MTAKEKEVLGKRSRSGVKADVGPWRRRKRSGGDTLLDLSRKHRGAGTYCRA